MYTPGKIPHAVDSKAGRQIRFQHSHQLLKLLVGRAYLLRFVVLFEVLVFPDVFGRAVFALAVLLSVVVGSAASSRSLPFRLFVPSVASIGSLKVALLDPPLAGIGLALFIIEPHFVGVSTRAGANEAKGFMCRAVAKESEREKNARNYVAAQKEKKEKYEYINKGIFKTTKKKMYTW